MIMGFVFGGVTVLLYTKFGVIDKGYVGLTKIIIDFSQLAIAFSTFGVLPVLYKFYPYYNDNLPKKKNELLTLILIVCLIGFALFSLAGYFLKPYFVSKYVERSPLIVDNYIYLYVFAFGVVLFTVFETYAYVKHQSIVTNFLKETALRFITVVLMICVMQGWLGLSSFVLLYSLQFCFLFLILYLFLKRKNEVYFHFSISRVTKKFWKKMVAMQSLIYSGLIIMTLTGVLDSFIIGKLYGQNFVADFGLAQYGANLVNVPQKAMIGGSIGILTQAWKDKNLLEINRIYSRSCINLSLMALFLFGNIWLNALPTIDFLNIDPTWKAGMNTMFFICIARTIDASTGVNSLIIGTSTFWKFEFITGMVLLAVRMPTAWILIGKFGIIGSAYSDIISITIYNFIRYEYLRRKFKMQPFNYKNLLAIVLAVSCYFIAFYCCNTLVGFVGIALRVIIFSGLFVAGIFALKLTPDARQLWDRWVLKIR